MSNTVTVVGNLTRSPELRYTTSGTGIAGLGIAVNRRWKDRSDEWQEETSFFNVTAFGDLGENACASLTKGDRVVVVGRLQQRSYETREGDKRSVVEIVADEIAPSLRWATVQVERTERSTPGQRESGRTGDDPVYGDEEPF